MTLIKKVSGAFIILAYMVLTPSLSNAQGAPDSFADLSEELLPAVVNVYTTQNIRVDRNRRGGGAFPPGSPFEEFFRRFGEPNQDGEESDRNSRPRVQQRRSLGSGFIIDAEGIIITNNHVIDEADEISIRLQDGTELEAEVIGKDDKVDLAVLKVEADEPLPFVRFGDDTQSRVGDWVLAIGNPLGLGGTVTAGIISARNRNINSGPYDDYIQTDAAINRGNSGGPMFNMDGEVIGVNTAIYSQTGGNIGIGFAVPSTQAQIVIAQLREYGRTKRGRIGVRITEVSDEIAESLGLENSNGALVNSVEEDSPSERAGVEFGDIIIEFNGTEIKEMRDLTSTVANTEIGSTVPMIVLREGERKTLRITIDELDEGNGDEEESSEGDDEGSSDTESIIDLTLAELDDDAREELEIDEDIQGVLITSVDYDSGREGLRRLRRGDVIVEVTQRDVSSIEDVKERIEAQKSAGRSVVLLSVYRRGEYAHVPISLDEDEEEE
ncbi:Do family serine endopeptidase [Pseudemcibacter aquimaris]|uniref:Do family serine endopeptidase n=1 Tax=Pseudemcibacter aquimaris TaxID=2857064 RepID=UPI0020133315|nr:Do family serine endopeptidase [Pseudemcibacter aquimaris]MCC3862164.1 Do family serine endopeptidase [Pseudemcibacter aquimaris]WDU58917.1 Do family serine endopeptidase [Pseudemcibacter aquimaris]